MARKDVRLDVSRRKFLAGVAVAGAATTVANGTKASPGAAANKRLPSAVMPNTLQIAAETGGLREPTTQIPGRPASDYMVDVIKSMKIEYIYSNPASSFRGLHESLINYGKNTMPEFLTATHEESSVAMCHGHFKATGKPQMALMHGTVGLQHAVMAVYNAWADRVPLIMIGGNDLDASKRPPGVPTVHSAQDINALVRDFTKWDDQPVSLQHFSQSFVRAYKYAMTPPYGPVMLALDAGMQEAPIKPGEKDLYTPKYVAPTPPHGDPNALREAAKLLVNAQNPVIVADRCARTQAGTDSLVQLAELIQCPVVSRQNKVNFPNTHYLSSGPQVIRNADVILGLELTDIWGVVNGWVDNGDHDGHGITESRHRPDVKLIHINSVELNTKSNLQDIQRFMPVDILMPADAEASLPMLIEFVKQAITGDRKTVFEQRAAARRKAFAQARASFRQRATLGWDASPISAARMTAELWPHIKDLDWSMVNSSFGISPWTLQHYPIEKHYQWLGGSGAAGQGYGTPASVGAAVGNKSLGRFSFSIEGDGDFMYLPGALWTASHHNVPMLMMIHNNRGYHQEVMHLQRMSNRRNRVANLGKTMGPVGTSIENPDIDYAAMAKSMGWWSAGPIKDPAELGAVLAKAVQVVRAGEPALVDVWTQPR
ncbi:MAG TPA: thiamine pyrophosphate-dependent enzyme [Xanthobacteraceae bacterium]|nr:thiamine pyrophosphate-dependent enzyme [Xanthobacteraceae bacterium]